jgi:PIN domain nuclease of toxin-antitoxin system
MLLLDTCSLLWLVASSTELSKIAIKEIQNSAGTIYISAISALEIAIKHKRKKLTLPQAPELWFSHAIELHGISELPVTASICTKSADLADIHNDPFDRLIIATALEYNLTILSPDHNFARYKKVKVLW